MRKLLLAFVALFVAMSTHAGTIYLVGSGTVNGQTLPGGPNGNCLAVTSESNVYTFEVNNISWLKISDTNASDWANFNKNGFTIEGKGDYAIKANELGTTFKLWYSDGKSEGCNNINPPSNGEYTYKITVGEKGTANSSLVVTAKSDEVITYDIYLRGSFNSYGTDAAYKFTPDAKGEVYTLSNVTLAKDVLFKIADADWGAINYGGAGPILPNVSYTLAYNGSDMLLGADINNATITFNIDTEVLYIKDDNVTTEYNDYTVYFDNSKSNWEKVFVYTYDPEAAGNWPGTEISKNDDGLYEWTITAPAAPTFGGIIFNNGITTDDGKQQTGDLVYKVGETYSYGESESSDIWVNLNGSFFEGNNGAQPNAEGIASWKNQPIGAEPVWIKVWDGVDKFYYSETPVKVDTWTTLTAANEDKPTYIEGQAAGNVYDVEYNYNNNQIKFTLISEGDDKPDVPATSDFYFRSSLNEFGEGTPMTKSANKTENNEYVYTITFPSLAKDTEFKVSNDANEWNVSYGAGENTTFNEATTLEAFYNGANFVVGADFSNVTINFYYNADGSSWMQLEGTVSGGGDVPDQPGDMSDWYVNVFGPFNDWTDNGVQPVDGISTTSNLAINDKGFKVKVWNGKDDIYYIYDNENAIPTDEWIQLYEDVVDGPTIKIDGADEETIYTVKFNCVTNQVYVHCDHSSSVEAFEVAEGDAVYFNLQGVKVANPDKGIYIKVVDGKAVKVIL